MARSLRKGPYIHPGLFKKIQRHLNGEAKGAIQTMSRASTILPIMENLTFDVHNGKEYIRVHIVPKMIGHKLGEFSQTRKPAKHSDKDKK